MLAERNFLSAPRESFHMHTCKRATIGAVAALIAIPLVAAERNQGTPVLAELFTSEGCSSCPPADALLQQLDRQPFPGAMVIVLSEHVDYWDRIGWKDPFSSRQFSARQEAYSRSLNIDSVYTPQLVIDGHDQFVGNDGRAIKAGIMRAAAAPKVSVKIVSAERDGPEVVIRLEAEHLPASASFKNGEVWIALADDKDTSQVARGENSGKTLTHVAVVRSLTSAGKVTKAEDFNRTVRVAFKDAAAGMRVIAFVQQTDLGKVAGADSARLP